jgi:hypothetical protein
MESTSAMLFVERVVLYDPTAVHWFNDRHDTSLKEEVPVPTSAGTGPAVAVTIPEALIVLIRGTWTVAEFS